MNNFDLLEQLCIWMSLRYPNFNLPGALTAITICRATPGACLLQSTPEECTRWMLLGGAR